MGDFIAASIMGALVIGFVLAIVFFVMPAKQYRDYPLMLDGHEYICRDFDSGQVVCDSNVRTVPHPTLRGYEP